MPFTTPRLKPKENG